MATALPAGWYADPADPNKYRYWTSDQWTAHVRDRSQVDRAAAARRPLPDFDTVAPDVSISMETPTRHRRGVPVLLSVLALVALVATAGIVTLGGSDPSGAVGQTLTGEIRVAANQAKGGGNDTFLADGTRCGTGAPPGVGAGTSVRVRNARGQELGVTELAAGQVDRTLNSITCVFTYEIDAVADAEVYSVQVAGRPAVRMTSAQLETAGWRADLRVG